MLSTTAEIRYRKEKTVLGTMLRRLDLIQWSRRHLQRKSHISEGGSRKGNVSDQGSSRRGAAETVETNQTKNHEVLGSIPGLAQQVKNTVWP